MKLLLIKNMCKEFEKGKINSRKALVNMNLELKKSEFVTIIGSNGAGKSTLFNAVAGNFWIDSGRIILDGKDITYEKEHKRAPYIGRVFQDPLRGTAPNMTIEENLALSYFRTFNKKFKIGISKKEKDFFKEHLNLLDMGLENRLKEKTGSLSGGQRQGLTLLMATINVPKLLLLDEHCAALDPAAGEKIMYLTNKIVSENKITCMMITHNMANALETGTRTLMLDEGRVVLDFSQEERTNMSVSDVIRIFREKNKKDLNNDEMLLA